MKLTLNNGLELTPILATGETRYVSGASRDTLSFVFSADTSMDELDAIFTASNCEKITLEDDTGSYIHAGYTVRAGLKREPVEVTPATEDTEAVYEERVTISMAQRNYTETQLANLTDTVDVLVMEILTA